MSRLHGNCRPRSLFYRVHSWPRNIESFLSAYRLSFGAAKTVLPSWALGGFWVVHSWTRRHISTALTHLGSLWSAKASNSCGFGAHLTPALMGNFIKVAHESILTRPQMISSFSNEAWSQFNANVSTFDSLLAFSWIILIRSRAIFRNKTATKFLCHWNGLLFPMNIRFILTRSWDKCHGFDSTSSLSCSFRNSITWLRGRYWTFSPYCICSRTWNLLRIFDAFPGISTKCPRCCSLSHILFLKFFK